MQLHRQEKKRLFGWLILLISIIVGMVACGGGGGGSSDPAPPSTGITTSELDVQFGKTVLDHEKVETITLQNRGTTRTSIGQSELTDHLDAPFSIIDDQCSGQTLAPSATCSLKIQFLPTTQEKADDSFDIPTGTGQPNLIVNVSGEGKAFNVSINQIDTDACPTVRLYVAVSDRADLPVTSLSAGDFFLLENGFEQDIISIEKGVATPFSVALALDYSFSIEDEIDGVEASAKSFIDQLTLNASTDEAAIIKFAAGVDLKEDYTYNKNALVSAIEEGFSEDRSQTWLYEAVGQAVDITADPARSDKRAVVVLSDGIDEGSTVTLTEIIDSARNQGVPVFTIGLGEVFLAALQELADETGGQYFSAPVSSDLQEIYRQITDILTNRYVIDYESSSSGGNDITVDVNIDQNGDQGEDTRDAKGCM